MDELIAQFQDNIKSKSMKNIHLIQIKSVIITLIPGIILNKYIKYNFQHRHHEEFIYILYFHHC